MDEELKRKALTTVGDAAGATLGLPVGTLGNLATTVKSGFDSLQDGQTPQTTDTPETLTSADLQPEAEMDVVQPAPTPTPDIQGFDTTVQDPNAPQVEMTDAERQMQAINEQLQQSNMALLGESEFRTQQEQQAGLPDLYKTQQDLSSRLKALQNEALAIPLQLQEESTGRGRTVAGLQPLQASALRKNAIQALSVNSLLEASRGNITMAQQMVDRAVSAKYDPIREQINALSANYQLVQNSPAATVQEKNRAIELELALQDRQRELDRQQNDEQARREFAMMGAELGVNNDVLESVGNARSYEEAYSIIAPHIAQRARSDRQAEEMMRRLKMRLDTTRIEQLRADMALKSAQIMEAKKLEQMEANTEKEAAAEKSLAVFSQVSQLASMPGLDSAVGFGVKKSLLGSIPFVSGEATAGTSRADFEAAAQRAANLLTIDNLKLMSGVLSETDIKILESAGSNLANFSQSEDAYRQEIQRVQEVAKRNFTKLGITDEQAAFWFDITPEESNEIDSILGIQQTESTFSPSNWY